MTDSPLRRPAVGSAVSRDREQWWRFRFLILSAENLDENKETIKINNRRRLVVSWAHAKMVTFVWICDFRFASQRTWTPS
jgi:hypothetical protein